MKIFIPAYESKKEEKIIIDDYDIWSLDYTLAKIIHPALILLKEKKQGAPCTDYEDAPEHLRPLAEQPTDDVDDLFFDRWDWIMSEMIWAFKELSSGGRWDKMGAEYKEYYDRIQNGLRLFAKYYVGLWD
jgi:hypothetical protein